MPVNVNDVEGCMYPQRMPTDELRRELDSYVQERQQADEAVDTIDLDRRKVT